MTPTDARAVAKFLGDQYVENWGRVALKIANTVISDADLLVALLERAAELGLEPEVFCPLAHGWTARIGPFNGSYKPRHGPTPLSALIAAVVAYGEKA